MPAAGWGHAAAGQLEVQRLGVRVSFAVGGDVSDSVLAAPPRLVHPGGVARGVSGPQNGPPQLLGGGVSGQPGPGGAA